MCFIFAHRYLNTVEKQFCRLFNLVLRILQEILG
jgi:hypothetical protein